MKLVVNKQYGGFGLSMKAEKLYAEKAGFDLYFYKQTKYEFRDGKNLYERCDPSEGELPLTYTFKRDLGPRFSEWPNNDIAYWYSGELKRDDPLLVEVVEELGDDANGDCASLEVINVPNDVDWTIEQYDGLEWVAEQHRTW